MVPRSGELPAVGLSGNRVDPHFRFACVQVERPGLGVQSVADHQRADAVADQFGPEEFAAVGRQCGDSAGIELAGEELLPKVAVEVHAEQHQHPVVDHCRLGHAPALALAAGAVQFCRPFP